VWVGRRLVADHPAVVVVAQEHGVRLGGVGIEEPEVLGRTGQRRVLIRISDGDADILASIDMSP